MGSSERRADRSRQEAIDATRGAGRELRNARRDRGLSLASVGRAIGVTGSAVSRIERGLVPEVSVLRLVQLAEVVGLELSVRVFPGGSPLRDAAHVELLGRLRRAIHPRLRWATEVPLPRPGDQRAWDAIVTGDDWRYGVEAETAPRDVQTLLRRLALKERDGGVAGVLLIVPRTRRVHAFLAASAGALDAAFPVDGARALLRLRDGLDPGGSAILSLGADVAEAGRHQVAEAGAASGRGNVGRGRDSTMDANLPRR